MEPATVARARDLRLHGRGDKADAEWVLQVEGTKLRDYEGSYERFLEKNEDEAEVMAEKEAKKKELEKSQIKAKSKARI